MIYGHTVTLGYDGERTDFKVIATTGYYDYSWDETAVLERIPDGALFLGSTGGCSCSSFDENLSLADLEPVTSFEAALLKVDAATRDGLVRSKAASGDGVNLYG